MTRDELIQYVSNGFDIAKAGQANSVYDSVAPWHDRGELPLKSHYPFGWIIYYALHQSKDHDIDRRKQMLMRYLKLRSERPHKLHSMILVETIDLYKKVKEMGFGKHREEAPHFSILGFLKFWGLANLRPGDWRRKEIDGKRLSSTVEKLITVCVDELEETKAEAPQELMAVIERAMTEYSDSAMLMLQRATLHILAGEIGKARTLLRNALLMTPGKFFLWSKLATLIDVKDNLRLHVALLYKALRTPGPEEFKGKIRLALAEAWLSADAFPQALWELNAMEKIYTQNGWHLSRRVKAAKERIPKGTQAADPTEAYRRVERLAEEELYASLPEIEATKTYHKNPQPDQKGGYGKPAVAWRLTTADGKNYWIQPLRFRLQEDLPNGTKLAIRVFNDKAVSARIIQ